MGNLLNNNKVYIIAEAGVNHNGKLVLAKQLIRQAKLIGADAIKFQSYITENLVTKSSVSAPYQNKTQTSQYKLLKKYELSQKKQIKLFNYCKLIKIDFLSSAFDSKSLNFLKTLSLKYYKIPSGEINNYPLLKQFGEIKKKIILSTGMASYQEIKNALKILNKFGTPNKNITILHCNSAYPTPIKDANLKILRKFQYLFKKNNIGYSDHTTSTETSLVAVALGSKIIEKHITINKKLKGPDHSSSFNIKEFKNLISSIRKIEILLGQDKKKISKSEIKNIKYVRKSIVAKVDIKKGDIFSKDNLTVKRPALGISPVNYEKLLGKKAKNNFFTDDFIKI